MSWTCSSWSSWTTPSSTWRTCSSPAAACSSACISSSAAAAKKPPPRRMRARTAARARSSAAMTEGAPAPSGRRKSPLWRDSPVSFRRAKDEDARNLYPAQGGRAAARTACEGGEIRPGARAGAGTRPEGGAAGYAARRTRAEAGAPGGGAGAAPGGKTAREREKRGRGVLPGGHPGGIRRQMSGKITVKAQESGERIDALLSRCVEGLTRSAAQRLIEQGAVTLGGAPLKKSESPAPARNTTWSCRRSRPPARRRRRTWR